MSRKCHTPPDVELSDSENSSSESEDDETSNNMLECTGMPKERSVDPPAGSVGANAHSGAVGGVGVSTWALAGCGCAATKTPSHTKGAGRQPPKCPFKPQKCRLCNHLHVFETRSGLNEHATMHHGCYYSSHGDCFIPIPEVDLQVRWETVREGQQHCSPQVAAPSFKPNSRLGRTRVGTLTQRFAAPSHYTRASQGRNKIMCALAGGEQG